MDWRQFLTLSSRHLLLNPAPSPAPPTWCAWTTFGRLQWDSGYWSMPMIQEHELRDTCTADGGTWGQPFEYRDIAHMLIPRNVQWELFLNGTWVMVEHQQDVVGLSGALNNHGIQHHLSDYALEAKLF